MEIPKRLKETVDWFYDMPWIQEDELELVKKATYSPTLNPVWWEFEDLIPEGGTKAMYYMFLLSSIATHGRITRKLPHKTYQKKLKQAHDKIYDYLTRIQREAKGICDISTAIESFKLEIDSCIKESDELHTKSNYYQYLSDQKNKPHIYLSRVLIYQYNEFFDYVPYENIALIVNVTLDLPANQPDPETLRRRHDSDSDKE